MTTENLSGTFVAIGKVIDRSEQILKENDLKSPLDRQSHIMDIKCADDVFGLNFETWLEADNFDFMHDFMGIMNNIDRSVYPATNFNGFVPRFVKK